MIFESSCIWVPEQTGGDHASRCEEFPVKRGRNVRSNGHERVDGKASRTRFEFKH